MQAFESIHSHFHRLILAGPSSVFLYSPAPVLQLAHTCYTNIQYSITSHDVLHAHAKVSDRCKLQIAHNTGSVVRADVLNADISNIHFISHEAVNEHEPKGCAWVNV